MEVKRGADDASSLSPGRLRPSLAPDAACSLAVDLPPSPSRSEVVPCGVELEVAVLPPRLVVLRAWRVRNRFI